jgi:hypothetical protein
MSSNEPKGFFCDPRYPRHSPPPLLTIRAAFSDLAARRWPSGHGLGQGASNIPRSIEAPLHVSISFPTHGCERQVVVRCAQTVYDSLIPPCAAEARGTSIDGADRVDSVDRNFCVRNRLGHPHPVDRPICGSFATLHDCTFAFYRECARVRANGS